MTILRFIFELALVLAVVAGTWWAFILICTH
jgi:hypothetical protein